MVKARVYLKAALTSAVARSPWPTGCISFAFEKNGRTPLREPSPARKPVARCPLPSGDHAQCEQVSFARCGAQVWT